MDEFTAQLLVHFEHRFDVECLEGEESIDELYRFAVHLYVPPDLSLDIFELGSPLRLDWSSGARTRVIHGALSALEMLEPRLNPYPREHLRLTLRPRGYAMTLGRRARAFQDVAVPRIIEEVLRPYGIAVRFSLRREVPAHAYVCQYDESDFDFVRRIASEHGLLFFYEQPAGPQATEVMLFADHPGAYPPLSFDGGERAAQWLAASLPGQVELDAPELPEAPNQPPTLGSLARALGDVPELHHQRADGALEGDERRTVRHVRQRTALRPRQARLRLYDPERPAVDLTSDAQHEEGPGRFGGLDGAIGDGIDDAIPAAPPAPGTMVGDLPVPAAAQAQPTEIYEHDDKYRFPEWDYDQRRPERRLASARSDHSVTSAESACPWLSAGHRFKLTEHPRERFNREYVVTSVRHKLVRRDGRHEYSNHFDGVESGVHFTRHRERPHVTAMFTGEVVGGAPGTVATNEMGMIKVRFHWDQARSGAATTCWLRVMQPWAGAGIGFQFLPRVGTEVVVGCEGGDPDRPIVLGGLYHRAQPMPFPLPDQWPTSGIRTQTAPGGEDGHELSFDDRPDRERILLRASRDLDVVTRRDRNVAVENDDRLTVRGERTVRVSGASVAETTGLHAVRATGGHSTSVTGQRNLSVRGSSIEQVEGTRQVVVTGDDKRSVQGRRELSVSGDTVSRHAGNVVQRVGEADAPRTMCTHVEGKLDLSASERVAIEAEGEIVLRCGKSELRLLPDRAELVSPEVVIKGENVRAQWGDSSWKLLADDKVQVKAATVAIASSGAAIGLSSEASVDGSKVLLNSPEQADDSVSQETRTPTHIELLDDEGEPLAGQPYRIVLGDGRQIAGTLDDDGRAEIDLPSGGDIFFPGLRDVREA